MFYVLLLYYSKEDKNKYKQNHNKAYNQDVLHKNTFSNALIQAWGPCG